MGCSYVTAKYSNSILLNAISTAATTNSYLDASIKNNNKNVEEKFQYNNCKSNKRPTKNHSNDGCELAPIEEQQRREQNLTKSTSTRKANKSSITTINTTYNFYNNSNNTINNLTKKEKTEIKPFSLESKEYTSQRNYAVSRETTNFKKKEKNNVCILQESRIKCCPVEAVCCEEHKRKQRPQLFLDEIINNRRHTLKPLTYIKFNNSNSYSNCSANNYCRCRLFYLYPKNTKNTLRNEKQCQPNSCDCSCAASQNSDFVRFTKVRTPNGHCLAKTILHTRTALTTNALDLKNNIMEVMANLEYMKAPFITKCLNNDLVSNRSNNLNINNNKNNYNKSETLYGGYCRRVNHLPNETKYISYISSSSNSMSNCCSLHNAITSNSRCNNNNHGMTNNSSSCCSSKNNHNNSNDKRFNNKNNYNNKTNSNNRNWQTSSSAAFNYIGQKYYSFLRKTINFYTASSVILVLCYLITSAAATKSDTTSVDKHPIRGIDWSKFDESSSDKEILDLLLEKKRYDKRLLPPVNDEDFCCGLSSPDMASEINLRRPHKRGTLTVNVNVLLLSLASPDESSLKYEVEFLLNQQWNDPRLQYGNKSHYDFLNALHHHDSIWTPDTYFIMHGDFKDPIIPMHFALRIYRNGTITYAMRRHLILSCQGSLHIFPFDDPKCSFSMESISYEEAQIKYIWKNDEDTLRKSPSLTTLNAYLIKNQTTACDQNSWRGNYSCLRVDLIFTRDRAFYFTTVFIPGIILVTSSFITFWLEWNAVPARSMIGNYSCLQVELTFTRDRAYYFTTVFIPGIILVTSSFITFWLEWNAVPARVMIGVTTMLNFFTTSNGFRSTLPVVSNLTAMNVWDGVCMCFIYASLLEFVCVNYMGRKRPQHNVVYRPGENPVTQRLPAVLSRIGVILASPLEIIEREFHAALSSEKAATGVSTAGTSLGTTPTPRTPASEPLTRVHFYPEPSGGIIATAVQNLRSRSLTRRSNVLKLDELPSKDIPSHVYEDVYTEPGGITTFAAIPSIITTVTIENDTADIVAESQKLRRTQCMSTNTPSLICKSQIPTNIVAAEVKTANFEQMPIKPPRKKSSRSTSPSTKYEALGREMTEMTEIARTSDIGEKKRDTGGPNEIVACTTCGGGNGTPCTHSAKNGCATETCFVQVRKKEPPHPIRIAKTIDVIARITFPTAYAIFLIFFFVHYKGFS